MLSMNIAMSSTEYFGEIPKYIYIDQENCILYCFDISFITITFKIVKQFKNNTYICQLQLFKV